MLKISLDHNRDSSSRTSIVYPVKIKCLVYAPANFKVFYHVQVTDERDTHLMRNWSLISRTDGRDEVVRCVARTDAKGLAKRYPEFESKLAHEKVLETPASVSFGKSVQFVAIPYIISPQKKRGWP